MLHGKGNLFRRAIPSEGILCLLEASEGLYQVQEQEEMGVLRHRSPAPRVEGQALEKVSCKEETEELDKLYGGRLSWEKVLHLFQSTDSL